MDEVLEEVRVMLERCFQRPVGFREARYVYREMKEIITNQMNRVWVFTMTEKELREKYGDSLWDDLRCDLRVVEVHGGDPPE